MATSLSHALVARRTRCRQADAKPKSCRQIRKMGGGVYQRAPRRSNTCPGKSGGNIAAASASKPSTIDTAAENPLGSAWQANASSRWAGYQGAMATFAWPCFMRKQPHAYASVSMAPDHRLNRPTQTRLGDSRIFSRNRCRSARWTPPFNRRALRAANACGRSSSVCSSPWPCRPATSACGATT